MARVGGSGAFGVLRCGTRIIESCPVCRKFVEADSDLKTQWVMTMLLTDEGSVEFLVCSFTMVEKFQQIVSFKICLFFSSEYLLYVFFRISDCNQIGFLVMFCSSRDVSIFGPFAR